MPYYEIEDTQVNPNRAITSRVAYQLRDNMLAIAAREDGAPEVGPSRQIVLDWSAPATWTVPAHVYRIRVILVGAGGGGGGGGTSPGGGGGSGSMIQAVLAVEPGQVYDTDPGAPVGLATPDVSGWAGEDTTFRRTGEAEVMIAVGGGGGTANGLGGVAGFPVYVPGPTLVLVEDIITCAGTAGQTIETTGTFGGNGAPSFFGGGGRCGISSDGAVGDLGGGGGGGHGALSNGGVGGGGRIIIEY